MKEYELMRRIHNQCPNNQMREVFFEEVQTDDPVAYVRAQLQGSVVTVKSEPAAGGAVRVWADCDGMMQEFVFTPF